MTPLAERLRPATFDDVVGQEHILGERGALRRVISSGILPSMIFYGPSGTGKTTVANIIAKKAGMTLKHLNATIAQTKEVALK